MTKEELLAEYEALESEYAVLKQNSCDVSGHVSYARRLLDHVQRSLSRMEAQSSAGADCDVIHG